MVDLRGHVAIVTGASTGIGRETARGLATMGSTVVIISKDRGRADAAVADIRTSSGNDRVSGMLGDLASIQDTRRLAAEFIAGHDRLDILVNNAGIIPGERTVTADGLETAFAINHLAPFHLTQLLLDILKSNAPSRVVMMVSATAKRGDLDDLQSEKAYDGWSCYRHSKFASLLFLSEMARRLDGSGVTINGVYPGVTDTPSTRGMTGFMKVMMRLSRFMLKKPAEAALGPIWIASDPDLATSNGKLYEYKKPLSKVPEGWDDPADARTVWAVSERLIS